MTATAVATAVTRTVHIVRRHINRTTGETTWEMSAAAERVIVSYLLARGLVPRETIRALRRNARGRRTFKTGMGYAILDEDVFAGDGRGLAYEAFREGTGVSIRGALEWSLLPRDVRATWDD